MAMTRTDYETIARLFRGRCEQRYVDNGTIAALVVDFCNVARLKNERFDAEKFIKAAVTPEIDALIERVETVVDYGPPEINDVHYYLNLHYLLNKSI